MVSEKTETERKAMISESEVAMRVDTAREQKEKPVLIVSRTRCCKLHDQRDRAPTTNQRPRRGTLLRSSVGGARRGIQEDVIPQSDAGGSDAREQRQHHSQRVSGEKQKGSSTGTRIERSTSTIWRKSKRDEHSQ